MRSCVFSAGTGGIVAIALFILGCIACRKHDEPKNELSEKGPGSDDVADIMLRIVNDEFIKADALIAVPGSIICGAKSMDFVYTVREGWTDIPTDIAARPGANCNIRLFVDTPLPTKSTRLNEGEWLCWARVERSRFGTGDPLVRAKLTAFTRMDEGKRRLYAPTP